MDLALQQARFNLVVNYYALILPSSLAQRNQGGSFQSLQSIRSGGISRRFFSSCHAPALQEGVEKRKKYKLVTILAAGSKAFWVSSIVYLPPERKS
jgi:hypothetical protein